jgi:hypothetical protein
MSRSCRKRASQKVTPVAGLAERTLSLRFPIRWSTDHANRMQGRCRFLASYRETVSATTCPALSGFGLRWGWYQFYQIVLSLGLLQVAAHQVLGWSQLAPTKADCLVAVQVALTNDLVNAPRKPFTGPDPGNDPTPEMTRATHRTDLRAANPAGPRLSWNVTS